METMSRRSTTCFVSKETRNASNKSCRKSHSRHSIIAFQVLRQDQQALQTSLSQADLEELNSCWVPIHVCRCCNSDKVVPVSLQLSQHIQTDRYQDQKRHPFTIKEQINIAQKCTLL